MSLSKPRDLRVKPVSTRDIIVLSTGGRPQLLYAAVKRENSVFPEQSFRSLIRRRWSV